MSLANRVVRPLRIGSILLACLAAVSLCAQQAPQSERPLRVYVGAINGPEEEFARRVRARLADELLNRGVALVESEENADAILSGDHVQETTKSLRIGHHASMCIRGALRLTAKRGALLWSEDVASDRYAVSQTASFAQNAGKKIALALDEESKRKGVLAALQNR